MRLGKPQGDDLAPYRNISVDGLEVYCHADIDRMAGGGDVTVEVERTFFSRKLVLYGIRMDNH